MLFYAKDSTQITLTLTLTFFSAGYGFAKAVILSGKNNRAGSGDRGGREGTGEVCL